MNTVLDHFTVPPLESQCGRKWIKWIKWIMSPLPSFGGSQINSGLLESGGAFDKNIVTDC